MVFEKRIKIPLYGGSFTIILYKQSEQLQSMFKDLEFQPSIEDFDAGVFSENSRLYAVFSTKQKNYPTPGIIAHEAKHLVNHIFNDINHRLDSWNDEPECYLLGYIVDEIHKTIEKSKNS